METTDFKELFFNKSAFSQAINDLELLEVSVQNIADIWNKQEILSPFDPEAFTGILAEGPAYLEKRFKEALKKLIDDNIRKGLGKFFLTDNFRPDYSPETLKRIIESARKGIQKVQWQNDLTFSSKGQVSRRKGIEQRIRQSCTIYETPRNKKILDAGRSAAKALNDLINICRDENISRILVGYTGIIQPQKEQSNFQRPQEPTKPLLAVGSDSAFNELHFDVSILKYGHAQSVLS